MKHSGVTTLFPLFFKLKSLWKETLFCPSVYHLLLGLMVYLSTINPYFQGLLYCWLEQFVRSIELVAGFEEMPEWQEISLTSKMDFFFSLAAGKLNWRLVFSATALWEGQIKLSRAELYLLLSAIQCWCNKSLQRNSLGNLVFSLQTEKKELLSAFGLVLFTLLLASIRIENKPRSRWHIWSCQKGNDSIASKYQDSKSTFVMNPLSRKGNVTQHRTMQC